MLASMMLGVMMLGGVALAKDIMGTFGPDRLIGTVKVDRISGLGGPDYIAGKQRGDELYGGGGQDEVRAGNGKDRISGGFGSDDLFGGGGNDTISTSEDYKDVVDCGLGHDTAHVDKRDRVKGNCEEVRRSAILVPLGE